MRPYEEEWTYVRPKNDDYAPRVELPNAESFRHEIRSAGEDVEQRCRLASQAPAMARLLLEMRDELLAQNRSIRKIDTVLGLAGVVEDKC